MRRLSKESLKVPLPISHREAEDMNWWNTNENHLHWLPPLFSYPSVDNGLLVCFGLPFRRGCLANGGPMNFVFFWWDALGHPQTSLSWLVAHNCIVRQGSYSNTLKIPVVAVLVILGIFPLEILSTWFPTDVLNDLILSPTFTCP